MKFNDGICFLCIFQVVMLHFPLFKSYLKSLEDMLDCVYKIEIEENKKDSDLYSI